MFSSAQWNLISHRDTWDVLYDVQVLKDSTIYICGKDSSSGVIYRGHGLWNKWDTLLHSETIELFCLHFLNSDTGYLIGTQKSPVVNYLYRTVDGGITLDTVCRLTGQKNVCPVSTDIYFFDYYKGKITNGDCGGGMLISTNDGGYNWTFYYDSSGTKVGGNQFSILDSNTIFSVPGYYTLNGGYDWGKLNIPLDSFHNHRNSISFINKDTGIVVGLGVNGYVLGLNHYNFGTSFYTRDGGQTWTAVDIYESGQSNYVKMMNDTMAYASIDGTSRIYKTLDGGASWYPQQINIIDTSWLPNITYRYEKLDCLNDSTCIAVGWGSGILVTNNGGGALLGVGMKEEKNKNEILLFPNPGNGKYQIICKQNSQTNSFNLKIFNAQGKEIMNKKVNQNSFPYFLDLENEADGIYLIQLSNNNFSESYKIIKQ